MMIPEGGEELYPSCPPPYPGGDTYGIMEDNPTPSTEIVPQDIDNEEVR